MPARSRCIFVSLDVLRAVRGCDAETILETVGDATHPNFMRWVFNMAVNPAARRELRFWVPEVSGGMDKWAAPATVIDQILGRRKGFPRGEIEIAWGLNATTIGRLVSAGEIVELNHQLTRDSLAAFLERRLQ